MELQRKEAWMFMVYTLLMSFSFDMIDSSEIVRECQGSDLTLSVSGSNQARYNAYKRMYENCTHVTNSLVIARLEGNMDMSFLKDIREVGGSVLIVSNLVHVIPLPSLVVIRGSTLYSPNGHNASYSLFVMMNSGPSTSALTSSGLDGLYELQLPSLQEILAGDVFISKNQLMCFDASVNWTYILNRPGAKIIRTDNVAPFEKSRSCKETKCHDSCQTIGGQKFCWGKGSDMCQNLNSLNCSKTCSEESLRCYGPADNDCCHEQCAGGCTGSTNQDCLACQNYRDGAKCVEQCPPRFIYSRVTQRFEINANFKYHYNGQCVQNCGDKLVAQGDFCVSECTSGFIENEDGGNCIRCNGTCPKQFKRCIAPEKFVSGSNIEAFRNCTHIIGAIKIHNISFTGHMTSGTKGITLDQLEVFENVEEISDYLLFDAYVENMTSLSFFKKLRVINGQILPTNGFALMVMGTRIVYLGLTSFKEVNKGKIAIARNRYLCYADDFDYKILFRPATTQQRFTLKNADKKWCADNNRTCSDQCGSSSCWGPTDDMCWSCKGYRFNKRCLESCDSLMPEQPLYKTTLDSGERSCKRCDSECADGCTGDGSGACLGRCRNFENSNTHECVAKCPEGMYSNDDKKCQTCHRDCSGECSGGGSHQGIGGCNQCHQFVQHVPTNNSFMCLPEQTKSCSQGFYASLESIQLINPAGALQAPRNRIVVACRHCHSECFSCNNGGDINCDLNACIHYQQEGRCVPNCSYGYYNEQNSENSDNSCKSCTFDQAHLPSCAHLRGLLGPIVIVVERNNTQAGKPDTGILTPVESRKSNSSIDVKTWRNSMNDVKKRLKDTNDTADVNEKLLPLFDVLEKLEDQSSESIKAQEKYKEDLKSAADRYEVLKRRFDELKLLIKENLDQWQNQTQQLTKELSTFEI